MNYIYTAVRMCGSAGSKTYFLSEMQYMESCSTADWPTPISVIIASTSDLWPCRTTSKLKDGNICKRAHKISIKLTNIYNPYNLHQNLNRPFWEFANSDDVFCGRSFYLTILRRKIIFVRFWNSIFRSPKNC